VARAAQAGGGPNHVVIIGGSLAGLFAAAATASAGIRTTILERDLLPSEPRSRKGVPQDRQPHVLLHRGLVAAEELLPGLREDLIRHGGVAFDTGAMPWLGEYGWLPTWIPGFEFISTTRPLLEYVVRERIRALPEVAIYDGVRVSDLRRSQSAWQVICEDAGVAEADLVIDASGRSSRLPQWLSELGFPVAEPDSVDAQVGYACRTYRASHPVPVGTAVMVAATPKSPTSGLAMPVENDHWLIVATGYGRHRPPREPELFERFLSELRDPAIADLMGLLEPVGDIAIHRQTGNRRHHYGRSQQWPDGLLVVGDAYCAFNPVFGQGITVAASQALIIRDALGRHARLVRRKLQRQIGAVADVPWSVAIAEDLRQPSSDGRQTLSQRLVGLWSAELARLATHGDWRAYRAFARVYHLTAGPALLFHPGLFVSAARSALFGRPPAAPRPEVLDALHALFAGSRPLRA
jgi:2-polyprenyl-6-methoxyphenol hydroxylase-like FAD-dependent oxidoreductase